MKNDKDIFVIGDIHGCAKTLELLLEKIPSDAEVYSTGDIIDRGLNSKRAVSLCMERGIKAVMGNHEHMLLDYLDGTKKYSRSVFIRNGGLETLDSYGENVLPEHIEYIQSMPLYIETDDFVLSHAGVGLMQTLESACRLGGNVESNILWNRGRLADVGKIQIVGHCAAKSTQKYYIEGKQVGINIDTGCVYPRFGALTAMRIPDMSFVQVDCKD